MLGFDEIICRGLRFVFILAVENTALYGITTLYHTLIKEQSGSYQLAILLLALGRDLKSTYRNQLSDFNLS